MKKWLKTPLILALSLVTFAGCALPGSGNTSTNDSSTESVTDDGMYNVHFELCTEYKTNVIDDQEVEAGDVATKPAVAIIGDNPERWEVQGWYQDAEYTKPWNFFTNTVEEDITLYAKWVRNFEVTYYLGDDGDVPLYKQYVQDGGFVTDYEKLAHGYESSGFYTTIRHEEKFDFTKPITSDVNIFIDRSENFCFTGEMIATRDDLCYMMAAPSGSGSTPGTVELKEDEATGEKFAEINFGYSTAADPNMLIKNMAIDISNSQKVEVTFRNLGNASSLKFYYVVKMADGTFTDGEGPHEGNAFTYTYTADERNMDPNGEWVTKVFDFSSTLTNGVSTWGISSTLTQLRIQSGYICEDENDLSNVLQIKSIRGIPDDTYTSTADSESVSILRVHDDATDVEEVANAQADICGWVFPKDSAAAKTSNGEIYEKTSGLLFYSPFRAQKTTLMLTMPETAEGEKEVIDLGKKTTIRIRLTNYGYSNKITMEYKNKVGRGSNLDISIAPCGDQPEMKEYVLNMYGSRLYEGNLDSLAFVYDSIGVNNAIMIHSVELVDFERMDIPGFNFNDMFAGDETVDSYWTTVNNATVSYTGSGLTTGATKIDVTEGGYLERVCNTTNVGYESMTLKYMSEEGIRNVIVGLTIGGVETEYVYDMMSADVTKDLEWSKLTLPLEANGQVEKLKVRFMGEGSIVLQEIRFNLPANSGLDFSTSETASTINAQQWDGDIFSHNNALSAGALSAHFSKANREVAMIRYYYDALLKYHNTGDGNLDITGKTKMLIIYNNTGNVTGLNVGLGTVPMTEDDSWKTNHAEIGNSGGLIRDLAIKQNMAKDEWAVLEIDLSQFNTINGTDKVAINEIGVQQSYNEAAGVITVFSDIVYIRAIVLV